MWSWQTANTTASKDKNTAISDRGNGTTNRQQSKFGNSEVLSPQNTPKYSPEIRAEPTLKQPCTIASLFAELSCGIGFHVDVKFVFFKEARARLNKTASNRADKDILSR